ncbi:MAG TPA: homoserine O-succinyltransferase [Bradyrhizobium sp.]|nr:homoserine O-succinyltransferase [Bradyrhizobium sp.]
MAVLFDKHRSIASPALAPTQPRQTGAPANDRQPKASVITIGLINSMPDSALQSAERQFTGLLQAAAGDHRIHLHCFSLPSVKRSQQAKQLMQGRYRDIADLERLHFDGLIVTGAEPNADALPKEPFWKELTEVIDWAKTNTRSSIWSCLAAHAAVLHLDDIERYRLDAKCSGVYDCVKSSDDSLTKGLKSSIKVPHSRLNALRKSDLVTRGYQILTESREAGVDVFVKQLPSRFLFLQGHPEYEALSLQREYLRDITRYLSRHRDDFPAVPAGYFDRATENKLVNYRKRAIAERTIPLSVELPKLTLRPDLAFGQVASVIFRNWVEYLSDGVEATATNSRP